MKTLFLWGGFTLDFLIFRFYSWMSPHAAEPPLGFGWSCFLG